MRAVGYIRVSTEDQAKEGVSLDTQREKIIAYCRLKDMTLIEIIEDAGISAKNLNRQGVQKVLEMAQKKELGAVVVYKLDRLFRSTSDALKTTKYFEKVGVSFHSIQETLDTKSALGNFFFTLTAALAEMERRLIGERTRAALQYKRKKGERVGHIPFGYQLGKDGKHILKNPGEQSILRKIRSLSKKGLSLRQIANELNHKGITNRGRIWNHMNVKRVAKL